MVKYPSTISDYKHITNRSLVFAFEKYGGTTILHRMNGKTLNAIHVVPEYIEVAIQLGSNCVGDIFGQNSDDTGCIGLSSREGVSIALKCRGGLSIGYQNGDDKFADQVIEKYDNLDTDSKDQVECLLLMASIINETAKD